MIIEKDIKLAISESLKNNGFNVVASEVEEGFTKPAVFVTVYPAKVTLVNQRLEEVVDSIGIKYIPSTQTMEECINTTDVIKQLFLYSPLQVKDRKLTIDEIEFDIEGYVLYIYFDITYIKETPIKEQDEYNMESLEMGVNI